VSLGWFGNILPLFGKKFPARVRDRQLIVTRMGVRRCGAEKKGVFE
jgi:hypothetical protein